MKLTPAERGYLLGMARHHRTTISAVLRACVEHAMEAPQGDVDSYVETELDKPGSRRT